MRHVEWRVLAAMYDLIASFRRVSSVCLSPKSGQLENNVHSEKEGMHV